MQSACERGWPTPAQALRRAVHGTRGTSDRPTWAAPSCSQRHSVGSRQQLTTSINIRKQPAPTCSQHYQSEAASINSRKQPAPTCSQHHQSEAASTNRQPRTTPAIHNHPRYRQAHYQAHRCKQDAANITSNPIAAPNVQTVAASAAQDLFIMHPVPTLTKQKQSDMPSTNIS